jgi:hypothetical protein
MSSDIEELKHRVETLETAVSQLQETQSPRGVRKRSKTTLFGLPLYEIATGPDPKVGETRGHARGIIAIGDSAVGLIAIGGLSLGVIAIGGLAIGLFALGGGAIGLLAAFGGGAIGGFAGGGFAIGIVAFGGGAVGYYAAGGGAIGKYVISAAEQNPEAIEFFQRWFPGIADEFLKLRRGQ